ncbi:bifunctional UDP-sugar hydrolase/5'-nucleotidase [Lentisphaera marina]|uniref:bifunctional metallophosphatase/5'-nucleotidase n=1 Tax=Lentisphaera marina TaxID=1111041 RepID=UPI002365F155|nr:bifunctional UDP-sugar hydrolase/5'-nucleotidase [Lentisphaera marina]MDD7987052.1 bifunctional UDP-sugar hydrolase/5'-nucleotidase [Lentisphaera marina]
MPYIYTAFISIFFSLFCHAEQSLVILQTTDIHSAIFDEDSKDSASWLRMSSKIKDLRQGYGAENTLLIDCGDTIQGSLSASISRGEDAITILNHLNYDAWVPGNHELDFGSHRFLELCKQTQIPVLSANFEFIPKDAFEFQAFRSYQRAGKKIIVIGMQASFLHYWSTGSQFSNCRVWSAKSELMKIMPTILEQDADLIILALHQGLAFRDDRKVNEVLEIAKLFPEIHLILGGHTHREFPAELISNGVLYTQAGAHAKSLAKINIEFPKNSPPVIQPELIGINQNTALDPVALRLVQKTHRELTTQLTYPITHLESDLKAAKVGVNCRISHLIGHAILKASSADIAIHGRLSSSSLKKGPVGERELFGIIPYENDLFTAQVSVEELKLVMNEQMNFQKSYSFNAPVNFSYNHLEQSITLKPELRNKEKLTLCINSRVAASGGKRFPVLKNIISQPSAQLKELPIKTRDAVRQQLQRGVPNFEATLIF